ncbi:MAG: hypothetical protein CFE34_05650 [Rhodobacteraceae bacterium PARR1]|nr:MAG: hypothetical protein CFE34_05650 [Rhodobacteraceae bacterium PARR1]
MRQLYAVLLCGVALTTPAWAEEALPRLSPLAVVDGAGVATGEAVSVPFGQPLEVLDRSGAVVTVQDATGASFAVSAADLITPVSGLVAMAEPGRDSGDRPDLPLWDSAARGRLYLQGGGADSLRPALTEQPGGQFPVTGLPIFAVETAPTTIGHPVLMAGAWVPVMPEALDPSGTAAPAKVVLHVLVDGSDYARDFTLEALQHLSRTLSEGGKIAEFSRQVIYDNGALRDEGPVPAAGLRAEWPAAEPGDGTLTDALADALDALADAIPPGDDAAHVVLVLVGPGLGAEPDGLARVTAAGQRLTGLRGVVLAQGTPEPNPANDVILGQMAGGAAARFLDFGGDVMGAVDGVLSAAPVGDATAIAARRDALCALAAERALPCVIAAPGVLPPVAAADWVALPLWFVMDGAALDLVPLGMAAADARAAQDAIRACHAAGQVWDAAAADCAASAAPVATDPDGLRADLVALQGELATRSQERDTALDDLARLTADWEDQRSALRAESDEALANLSAAQVELDARAETIAAQEAQLAEETATVADLTDRADALALAVSDVQAELDAALAEAARLGSDLDSRDTALVAATDQVADLTAARDAALADLAQRQDDLAAVLTERDSLSAALASAKSERAAAETVLAQERADWQAQADAAAQALAEMTTARDQALAQLADLTAAQADLAAQVASLTSARDEAVAQVSELTAARDQAMAQVKDQTTARTLAESSLLDVQAAAAQAMADADAAAKKATAQLLAAETDYATLVAERDDLAARLSAQTARADDLAAVKADLSLAEGDIRAEHASVTRQLAEAQAKLADLTKAHDTAMTDLDAARASAKAEVETAQAALAEAQASSAALQAERDALAAQMASVQTNATATVQALTDRLAKSEAEVTRLSAELTAALTAPSMVEDMTAPTVAVAVNPTLKPKPRPAAEVAAAQPAKAPKPPKPQKAAVKVAANAPAAQPAPSRRVAPATAAPQLKGCQFQWVGKEGRLVCP